MTEAEIKAAIAVLITCDGQGKQAKCEALHNLLEDVAAHGPVSVIYTLVSNY